MTRVKQIDAQREWSTTPPKCQSKGIVPIASASRYDGANENTLLIIL